MEAAEEPVAGPGRALRLRLRRSPVTVGLIGVCLGVFVATLGVCIGRAADGPRVLLESLTSLGMCREALVWGGALELARVWLDGEWWRVGTTGLQHGSWLHVLLNTWSLWVVGEWAEATWGHARLLLLFVVSSTVGCLASLGWAEAPMVVGASAGVLGIAGALLAGRLLGRGEVARRLSPISARGLGITLAVLLAIGFLVPIIAQAGHIGGLAVGALLGAAWADSRRRARRVLGWVAVAAGALALVWTAREPSWRPGYHEFSGHRLLELERPSEAITAFDRALSSRPDDAALANAVAYSLALAGVELDRAEALVQGALEAEPDNADYLDTLGWIYCRRGQTEAGLTVLRRALEEAGGSGAEIEEHLEECGKAEVSRETSDG
jgi:membrane associated rhomboid family serine protease